MRQHVMQDESIGGVIVDHQRRDVVHADCLFGEQGGRWRTLDSKPRGKVECTSLAYNALYPQLSTHQLYEMRNDGQPQAGTAMLSCRRAISLGKGLKN